MSVLEQVRVVTMDGGGEHDVCHRLRGTRFLCGGEPPGGYHGPRSNHGDPVNGFCLGCERPMCPDCLAVIEAGR